MLVIEQELLYNYSPNKLLAMFLFILIIFWFRWIRKWQPTPVFLPGKFHGQKSLMGYSP